MLADGRFPAGGHAHSGGLEAAVVAGRVSDPGTLEAFLRGRVATSGAMAAAFAAAACAAFSGPPEAETESEPGTGTETGGQGRISALDTELEARTPAPALRATSRKLGRQLLRTARAIRPHPGLDALAAALPGGPHQPVALGAAARALGLGPHAAAAAALHDAATGPATAAVRLLGLDPFAVHAVLARLAPDLDRLATAATARANAPAAELPAYGAPSLDISAELHATWEVRLFAS
ncbi:urease accessory UreF family protein [Streptomyces coelicoflavus]|uniref:urease accessory protein UreF n=1 Tax=Streptomyces coelicoflavus TaxID=285562 RepID=UPI0024AD951A|nr:urease accessory UreF family protein [Streptomyces coelicoflavus]MDI6516361.1 urease accessory UreF family protein [Streptomyces coelicoflavus]